VQNLPSFSIGNHDTIQRGLAYSGKKYVDWRIKQLFISPLFHRMNLQQGKTREGQP
jgi:hypothetical protein